jgi:hypothetical protein
MAGFVLFYLALYVLWGYRPVAVVREALAAHREVTTASFARTYWKWVLMNPVECAIFAGIPAAVAAIWGWRGVFRSPDFGRLRPFLAAWAIAFVLLNLSGTVRGEVGRIWLFLIWPISVVAGVWLCGRSGRIGTVVSVLLLQIAQAILMRAHLTIYDIR